MSEAEEYERTKRRSLTDEDGWFDPAGCIVFNESRRWDGNNRISGATGSQWDHEELFHTKHGNWILHAWSQRQGSGETYRRVSVLRAAQWLLANEAELVALDELTDGNLTSLQEAIESLEV